MKHDFIGNMKKLRLSEVQKYLHEVMINYRPYDPGNYLYKLVLKERDLNKKFSEEYIELLYTTLSAWNMNSRGAKLSEFSTFKKSIIESKHLFGKLENYKLGHINSADLDIIKILLKELYVRLDIVGKDKPKLVTFSKLVHFMMPNLMIPIDRTYTIVFYFGHTNIPKSLEKQFEIYYQIMVAVNDYIQHASNLKEYIDDKWNLNICKIIDNIIIGYVRMVSR